MRTGKEVFRVGGKPVAAALPAEIIGVVDVNVTRLPRRRIDRHTADGINGGVGGDVFRVCGHERYPEAASMM
jgi:hypothetical protein